MARIARKHVVGGSGFYHVFNRVAGEADYFPLRGRRVRRQFMRWLRYCLRVTRIGCVGFVLMENHYHLVLRKRRYRRLGREKLQGYAQARWGRVWGLRTCWWGDERWERFNRDLYSLEVLMRDLQGPFARWFNRHFNRRGHLWGQRYKCVKLEDWAAVRECLYYIELNPVRAGLCKRPEQWNESSASQRWLGEDSYLMGLEEVYPEIESRRRFGHYRGGLLERGAVKDEKRGAGSETGASRRGERMRPGLYLQRLRFWTDGLIVGPIDEIREHLERLREKGVYRLRTNPVVHLEGLVFGVREQRSSGRS